MQFQHPSFLWALGFLAIPILIHLFNLRRYKTVYFSDIRFLKDVQQTTKRQKKLKEWLVLAMRMLALAALVLAFAKPFFPVSTTENNNEKVLIVLDNSPSTTVGIGEISPFEQAKKIALILVDALPASSQISLISSNSSNVKKHNKSALIEEIKTMTVSDRPLNILPNQDFSNTSVYFLSDLQKNSLPFLANTNPDGNWVIIPTVTPEESSIDNVCIDSVWVEAPFLLAGQPLDFFIRFKNYGNQIVDIDIELLTNGLPEINLSTQLKPNKDTVVKTLVTQLKSGFNNLQINILNEAVLFDNRYEVTYFLPTANRVIEIYQREPSNLIGKIFTGDEFSFESWPVEAINAQKLTDADLIILNALDEISSGLTASLISQTSMANLFLIPAAKNPEGLNDLCTKLGIKKYDRLDTSKLETQKINTEDAFFQEVFAGSIQDAYWPSVKKHFKVTGNSILPTFPLMTLTNGDPLFIRYANKTTNVFQLSVPLDDAFSDISTHPVIIPLFIKSLLKKDNIVSFTGEVGKDARFDLRVSTNSKDIPLHIVGFDADFIPRQQARGEIVSLVAGADLQRSGNYKLIRGEEQMGEASFNVDRLESNLQRFTVDELDEILQNRQLTNVTLLNADAASIKTKLSELQQGVQLWKYFLLAALMFILLEVILLRLLK